MSGREPRPRRAHATFIASLAALAMSFVTTAASAEDRPLGLDDALRLAREHAPELRVARAATAKERADVDTARTWRQNPSVVVEGGPRFADETTVDLTVGVAQTFTPGGRPAARAAAARAQLVAAEFGVADEARLVQGRAARAFTLLLYWQDRLDLARRHEVLAAEVEAVAKRRYEVGDVGSLDPALAALARARSLAGSSRAQAQHVEAESELRWLLGIAPGAALTIDGDLRSVARSEPGDPASRSDVLQANAEVEAAQARRDLATRFRFPDVTIGAFGGREENATIVGGVLEVTLPFFWRGQADLLAATALEQARREEATFSRALAEHEAHTARRKVVLLDEAVTSFAELGLDAVKKTAEIAKASYRAGALGLADLLVVQRELVAAEEEFAELLLLAALSRVELLKTTGAFDVPYPHQPQENR